MLIDLSFFSLFLFTPRGCSLGFEVFLFSGAWELFAKVSRGFFFLLWRNFASHPGMCQLWSPNFTDNMEEDIDEEILEEKCSLMIWSLLRPIRIIHCRLFTNQISCNFCCSESAKEYTDDGNFNWNLEG